MQSLIVENRNAASLKPAAQVIVEAIAIDMPEMAMAAENAVLRPFRRAPRRALLVSGDVARGAKILPQSQHRERLSNGPGKRFAAPVFLRGRTVQHDAVHAQIGKVDGRGRAGRSGAKYADAANLLHRWVLKSRPKQHDG